MYNKQLDTFIRVAEAGSFSKAAEELYISPTAVIKQINILEANLDLVLFKRTHRGLTLTEAGKSIYRDAKVIIKYSEEAIIKAKNSIDSNENIIRIGTSFMTPTNFLLNLWPKVNEISPEIKFKLVPFENTPKNAVEILKNLGQNIDVVAGIYDEGFLRERQCKALEMTKAKICVAVSIHHRLAERSELEIEDLFGENLLIMKKGWNKYFDLVREKISQNYSQINIKDFSFYDLNIFNQCENSNDILMVFESLENVHPLLKTIPITFGEGVPFGLMHSPNPSIQVKKLLQAVEKILSNKENKILG